MHENKGWMGSRPNEIAGWVAMPLPPKFPAGWPGLFVRGWKAME